MNFHNTLNATSISWTGCLATATKFNNNIITNMTSITVSIRLLPKALAPTLLINNAITNIIIPAITIK